MDKEQLHQLCEKRLLQLGKLDDKEWNDRFKAEYQDVLSKGDAGYFLKTRQECSDKRTYYANEHNSIIPYLLGICRDFDISKKPAYDYGEYPDIDIDYIDGVREYLKEEYAKDQFGEDKVCNIANYNTFGMKLALKDLARVFGEDHDEIEAITKKLKDEKDDEGNALTWDQTLEIYDELKDYCDAHPDLAKAAKHMIGRIRGLGQHASGLIVSSVPIRDYVPLVRGKEGSPASAWIEGLHGTDLSTVGFIKFDFLGLDGNSKIATTCKMACQDRKFREANKMIENIVGDLTVCALPGFQDNGQPYPSWSDTTYLNDPKCMEFAKRGDLRMVFQFDGSQGIRRLAKDIGCNTFEDLVATTALYRPGPRKLKYDNKYALRKNGKEEWTVHPLLAEGDANLSFTYGVLTYQEQISRLLNTIGKVPWADCDVIRKAISKKKIEKFKKYQDAFILGGQETLGESKEYLEHLWDQIEAFAGYGFNLSHAVGYTYISSRMLWLKAHLPKQFFASMFTHTKASGPKDYNKLKEYKREAERNGVKMAGLNINKSKKDFVVNPEDNTIYYGFNKIKGIGEEAAKRLEDLQPYTSFEDFLKRFGTYADPVKAVIALNCFKEHDPVTLYKFYEYYKKFIKSETDRIKRFETTKAKIQAEILELQAQSSQLQEIYECNLEDDPETQSAIISEEEGIEEEIAKLQKKLTTCIANKEKKDEFVVYPSLETFRPDEVTGLKLNEEYIKLLNDPTGEEKDTAFYGYVWQHPLERLPNYSGHTFEEFLESDEKDGTVEAIVRQVQKKKGAKATYYSIEIEDATCYKRRMTVWEDDYERFKDEFQEGKMLRIWVDEPQLPYRTFTLHSLGTKWRKPPKANDYRVTVLN